MDVVVESGNESMEVVSMILHCWFTNNEEGSLFLSPFVHCLESLRFGPFVWPLMRGVVSVAVGAAILLALRRCLRRRRRSLKAEPTISRLQDTTSVEINRVDTPTRLNHSSLQLTIIPSPIKPPSTATAGPAQTSLVEVVQMDFKAEAGSGGDGGDHSETESTNGTDVGVEVVDSSAAQQVQDVLLETSPHPNPPASPTHYDDSVYGAVVEQTTETSELAFNLTFNSDESDSDDDESDSHSITVANPQSSSTNAATSSSGVLKQRMLLTSDGEHTLMENDTVVTKAIFTVI